jgi:L-threonylcarbamoyladenylate synthase
VSVILPCLSDSLSYLHRGTQSIAFRIPDDERVYDFLQKTGPLVAPSANPQGQEPAYTIEEARSYFSDRVDFYVDEGEKRAKPSTLISLVSGKPVILRK